MVRTEKNNIRLNAFNGAYVIFNWEQKPQELRVGRPDGTDKPESGSVATAPIRPLEPNTWYTLRWYVFEEGMQVSINDQVVFQEARKNDLSWKRQVGVASVESIVEVKSFTVRPLGIVANAQGQIGEVRKFEGNTDLIRGLAVSPDGKRLLTACFDKTIRLWDVSTGGELAPLADTPIRFTPLHSCRTANGRSLAARDKTVRLWDLASGQEIRSYTGPTQGVHCVAVSGDGRVVIAGGPESTAFLWDVETGKELHRLEVSTGGLESVAISRDGKLALTGSARSDSLVECRNRQGIAAFAGHFGGVMGLAFSPDNRYVYSASWDKTLCAWRVEDGREVRRFPDINCRYYGVALSTDGGRLLTSGEDGSVHLWDAESGKEIYHFQETNQPIWPVVFSPDGKYAFSAGQDKVAADARPPPADYVPPPEPPPAVAKKPEPKPDPPAGDALTAADRQVKNVYKDDFKKKKKEEVRALADKLEKDALATKDVPSRYALFREARDAAARADDLTFAFHVADEMADGFAVGGG